MGLTKTKRALDVRVGLLFMSWVTFDESASLSVPGFLTSTVFPVEVPQISQL